MCSGLFRHVRDAGSLPLVVAQGVARRVLPLDVVVGHQGDLADVGGDHVHRLGEAGCVAAQGVADQLGPFSYNFV